MGKPSRQPTEESIRLRAYELWQEKGCPMGDDKTDWLEAERQLSPEPENELVETPGTVLKNFKQTRTREEPACEVANDL